MSRNALTVVFPAAVALLVCSLVVLFLTATGLEPGPSWAAEEIPQCGNTPEFNAQSQPRPVTVSLTPEDALAVAAGDALFKSNCAQCHAVNEVVVGPALAGIDKRRPMPWILKWVKNSSKVVASGDEYAVKLFNQYQKQQMPSFALSDEEIRQIIRYVTIQEGAPAPRTDAHVEEAVAAR